MVDGDRPKAQRGEISVPTYFSEVCACKGSTSSVRALDALPYCGDLREHTLTPHAHGLGRERELQGESGACSGSLLGEDPRAPPAAAQPRGGAPAPGRSSVIGKAFGPQTCVLRC